jgi:hypothetical protein
MMKAIVLLSVVVGVASGASGQQGVRYRLDPQSRLVQTYCLGPCACAPNQVIGALQGTFTLTPTGQNPPFHNYAVTLVAWEAISPLAVKELHGSGTYKYGGEVALTQQLVLDLSIDAEPVRRYDSGVVPFDPAHPFPQLWISAETAQFGCNQNGFDLRARPVPCYPDCDGSGSLNVNDFVCFMNAWAAGDPYANCDQSWVVPILNVNDFACFQQFYAAGCP